MPGSTASSAASSSGERRRRFDHDVRRDGHARRFDEALLRDPVLRDRDTAAGRCDERRAREEIEARGRHVLELRRYRVAQVGQFGERDFVVVGRAQVAVGDRAGVSSDRDRARRRDSPSTGRQSRTCGRVTADHAATRRAGSGNGIRSCGHVSSRSGGRCPPQVGGQAAARMAGRPPVRRHSSGGSTIACAASFWRTRNAARRFA